VARINEEFLTKTLSASLLKNLPLHLFKTAFSDQLLANSLFGSG
jgi:hypothetical protein